MYSKSKITEVAATIAMLMGIEAPAKADAPNPIIVNKAKSALAEGEVFDRVLLYRLSLQFTVNSVDRVLSLNTQFAITVNSRLFSTLNTDMVLPPFFQ